jgi:hypothetical protein
LSSTTVCGGLAFIFCFQVLGLLGMIVSNETIIGQVCGRLNNPRINPGSTPWRCLTDMPPAGCTFHPSPHMENPPDLEAREHDLTMHVFTVSACMVGMGAICAVIAYAIV